MIKFCPSCKQNKPITDFAKHSNRKDGLQSSCKPCMKVWSVARYQRTKDEHKQSRRALRNRNREVIAKYLETHPCVDCGLTDIYVLTFDHVRGEKKGNVSEMSRLGWGLKTIFEEIAKCEVRCFNCHMRKDCPRALSEAGSGLMSGVVPLVGRQLPASHKQPFG
jgi:hypothetical protein